MRFTQNQQGIQALKLSIADSAESLAELGVEEAQARVHVNTGRLQRSIQVDGPHLKGEKILASVVATVPYAMNEELHHPFMVPALGVIEREVG